MQVKIKDMDHLMIFNGTLMEHESAVNAIPTTGRHLLQYFRSTTFRIYD